MTKQFATKITGSAEYACFTGEMQAAFDTSTSERVSTRYTQFNGTLYQNLLNLPTVTDLHEYMHPDAKDDFDGAMDAAQLVKT
ncbi:MAG: hypothetical protein V2I76_12425 [Roseobacter sp.]|nr:hypothetical protein [Roseobacter sp.]